MAYSLFGTAGEVRFRTLGRRAGRGPRGIVNGSKKAVPVVSKTVERTHTKLYTEPKRSFFSRVASATKRLLRVNRGNR